MYHSNFLKLSNTALSRGEIPVRNRSIFGPRISQFTTPILFENNLVVIGPSSVWQGFPGETSSKNALVYIHILVYNILLCTVHAQNCTFLKNSRRLTRFFDEIKHFQIFSLKQTFQVIIPTPNLTRKNDKLPFKNLK